MNTTAPDDNDLPEAETTEQLQEDTEEKQEEKQKLSLDIEVKEPSACERHVTVTIARDDIDRCFDDEFADLVPKAEVAGFRPGRAPRKLVENRFKEQIADQVKGKLLVDSLEQVNEEKSFAAISEPDFDLEAVVLPDSGPMTFEFTIEVRPEFTLPVWKGLNLENPQYEVTDAHVTRHLERVLSKHCRLTPREGGAELGDFLTINMRFTLDGEELSVAEGKSVQLRKKLSLRDAEIDSFGELMQGAVKGDKRKTTVTLSSDLENETLAGKQAQAEFEVLDVESFELPKLTPSFLHEIGGFESEEKLREFVMGELRKQADFRQQQEIRRQITEHLTATAHWDLPPRLLRKQSRRELQRTVLELQSAGFSEDVIQQHANQLQRNSLQHTRSALKEHFILEKLAEDEKIDAEPDDFDEEIVLLAQQGNTSPRRVRAKLEKRGEMDSLRNQIVERKVIDLITSHASVIELPADQTGSDEDEVVALDHAVGGADEREAIPEAKHDEEGKSPATAS